MKKERLKGTETTIEIQKCENAELAIKEAITALTATLEQALETGKSVLLFLSGGSNLKLLGNLPKNVLNHKALSICVFDERFSKEAALNNSLQIQALGLPIALSVPTEEETLSAFAGRFNQLLSDWLANNEQGIIIATLGMGPDGHIAGISPFPDDPQYFTKIFMNQDALAVGYVGNLQPPERVTVTPKLLAHITTIIGVITGQAKQTAWQAFMQKATPAHVHPVQLLHALKAKMLFFTDL